MTTFVKNSAERVVAEFAENLSLMKRSTMQDLPTLVFPTKHILKGMAYTESSELSCLPEASALTLSVFIRCPA